MKIAIDFDGTLCERRGIPTRINWDDKPMEGARESIALLISKGHEVWVSTSNSDLPKVREWMDRNGFQNLMVTNKKIAAQVYIDDRAIRFTNWNDIRKYFA